MEGDPAHPHKSPSATVHQNLGRRGDCSLDKFDRWSWHLSGSDPLVSLVIPGERFSFLFTFFSSRKP